MEHGASTLSPKVRIFQCRKGCELKADGSNRRPLATRGPVCGGERPLLELPSLLELGSGSQHPLRDEAGPALP